MKKTFALLLALALLLSACLFTPARAGECTGDIGTITNTTPFFIYTNYSAGGVWGYVEIPENFGPCWVRITYFLPDHSWFAFVVPVVKEGEFYASIYCPAEYVTLALVDRYDAAKTLEYETYDAQGFYGLASDKFGR